MYNIIMCQCIFVARPQFSGTVTCRFQMHFNDDNKLRRYDVHIEIGNDIVS